MTNRAVIYARYSSTGQNDQSIDTQIDICSKYAKNNDLVIINTFIDRGLTGTNANRPGFQKMIEESYLNRFDYVIVYKFDRFARDEYDDIHYEKILNDNNVKRLSATEAIPDDRFSAALIKAVTRLNNEQYSRVLSERVNAGLDKNVEKGLMVGGSVTFGYKMIDKKYVIDETTAPYVRTIFEMYSNGERAIDIIEHLSKNGIYNVNGKPFQLPHIMKILRNKRYIGTFTYKGKEHPNFVPHIIDDALFNMIQSRVTRARNRRRVRSTVEYYLTGKLFCGQCGKPMVGYSGKGKSGRKFYYYHCRCQKKNEPKEKLEKFVVSIAINQVVNSPHLDEWIDRSIKVYSQSFNSVDVMIKQVQSEIRKTKNQISNIMEAIKQGIITSSTKNELISLEDKLNLLNNELTLKEAMKPASLDKKDIKRWFKQANKMDHKDILDALVKKVIIYDDKIDVSFYLSDKGVSLELSNAHQSILYTNTTVPLSPDIHITVQR